MTIQLMDQTYSAKTYARADVVFVRGEGARLFDANDKAYVDFGSGIGVMSLGYGHARWTEAVAKQAADLAHTSNLFYNPKTAELAAAVCRRTGFERVFFSNSGAEANECLIKTARKWANETKGAGTHPIVTLIDSFHGRTLTTVTATGQECFHKDFHPFVPGFLYAPANDVAALEDHLKNNSCAAVLLEIVQGEGGVRALDAEYLTQVQALCAQYDVLFCVDEVQTGNGRTGSFFAFEQFGLKPDLVSTAKGLGGGLPIGATLMNEKTADVLVPGTHGSTFGGNPVAAAAALVVLETVDAALLARVNAMGERIRAFLADIDTVTDVSGLGLMLGFSVTGKSGALVKQAALERGLVILTAKDRVRLLPPLTMTDDELDEGLNILKAAIEA